MLLWVRAMDSLGSEPGKSYLHNPGESGHPSTKVFCLSMILGGQCDLLSYVITIFLHTLDDPDITLVLYTTIFACSVHILLTRRNKGYQFHIISSICLFISTTTCFVVLVWIASKLLSGVPLTRAQAPLYESSILLSQ